MKSGQPLATVFTIRGSTLASLSSLHLLGWVMTDNTSADVERRVLLICDEEWSDAEIIREFWYIDCENNRQQNVMQLECIGCGQTMVLRTAWEAFS